MHTTYEDLKKENKKKKHKNISYHKRKEKKTQVCYRHFPMGHDYGLCALIVKGDYPVFGICVREFEVLPRLIRQKVII